jgi:hypothetical protein
MLVIMMWSFSIGVLVVAYGAIVFYTGNPLPLAEIVHESGDRTLLGTILYFDHAARELPLDVLLGMAVGGSVVFALPPCTGMPSPERRRKRILFWGIFVVAGVILSGTLWTGGVPMFLDNLFQMPTRPGEPLFWGAHWGYHLLSQATLMLVSFGLAAPVVRVTRGPTGAGNRAGLRIFKIALTLFTALAVVFLPSLDPFRDPVYIGHQAREVFTHVLVTIPLAWGFGLLLARRHWSREGEGTIPLYKPVVAGIMSVLIGIYLCIGVLATSAVSQGQTQSLVILVFPHFFEHTFSYLVATLMAGLVVVSAMARKEASA